MVIKNFKLEGTKKIGRCFISFRRREPVSLLCDILAAIDNEKF